MDIFDFNRCIISDRNGTYGGDSGHKEGVLINNEYWLIKYPKKAMYLRNPGNMSYSTSPISEYIGSHVYGILGYPVHETLLGIRNNHIVVACKDLCKINERLIEFRQLKNTYNRELTEKLEKSYSSTGSNYFINLEDIQTHFKYNPSLKNIKGMKERFWDSVIIDGFINNNDRNNGNWGIIRNQKGDFLAPVFDNGASLSPNISEEKILQKLKDINILKDSSLNGITAYSLNGKTNALFREILNLNIPDLNKAVEKNVPLIQNNLSRIFEMIDDIPPSIVNPTIGRYDLITEERKTVYKKEMELRLSELLIPTYEKIIDRIPKKPIEENYVEKDYDLER